MSSAKTRLLAFSDDMDGLRKVPTNLPNQEMLTAHLGKPLTTVSVCCTNCRRASTNPIEAAAQPRSSTK